MNHIAWTILAAGICVMSAWAADENENQDEREKESEDRIECSEFLPAGVPGDGFLTRLANNAMERAMAAKDEQAGEKPKVGRHLTDYVSAPKVGGYFIGKYGWTDEAGKHGGDGFSQRMIRLYVDGTVLRDFKYRIQAQVNNDSFHMKDYFIEWSHWKELAVKVGQYKRAFLFENLFNPWEIGLGDNAQVVRKLAGMSDYCGEPSGNGGRDQGLQLQGDLFPSKRDGHRFLHYQLQLMNGQGINASDQNRHKDWIGALQVQPVKDLFFGVFGWTGNYVANGVTVDRKRWAVGGRYEHNDWSARIEYARHHGHKISEYIPSTNDFSGRGRADGWYATLGMPVNKWLKVYVKYDAFRDQADWQSLRTMYSVVPNAQIHKNLMLQVQYNYVHDRTVADRDYNELWAELYVRF